MTDSDTPRTAAGRALITAVEHGGVRCTNESGWCHMQDAKLVREALLAIEAEAAQPVPLDTLTALADAAEGVTQYVRLGDGPLGDDPAAIAMRRLFDALDKARLAAEHTP